MIEKFTDYEGACSSLKAILDRLGSNEITLVKNPSYVFQPYTMVKDHRTNFQVGNVEAVLNGELDGFIESYLRHRAKARTGNG